MSAAAPSPAKQAAAKGLKYVSDSDPGIHRHRRGKHFHYTDHRGRTIIKAATIDRIRKLAIPPAYERVWVCAHDNGHLQATGIDARGRKQYRYHAKWRLTRDAYKFTRMIGFGERLPKLRRQLKRDLALPGLPKDKVLALVVTLLQETLLRVGNVEYQKQNRSYGLTTLRDWHVKFFGKSRARLQFRGKSGKQQMVELNDRRLAHIVRRCHDLPGQHLFQYVDEAGETQQVDSGKVNEYLRNVMGTAPDGSEFTAKDFRTWGATLAAIKLLVDMELPRNTRAALNRGIVSVCKQVSEQLGNTPAICRKSYINPWVFTAWAKGLKPPATGTRPSRRAEEQYALWLLSLQARHEGAA